MSQFERKHLPMEINFMLNVILNFFSFYIISFFLVTERAREKGVSISVITIKGTACLLPVIGQMVK
jgi:hypothetical protein